MKDKIRNPPSEVPSALQPLAFSLQPSSLLPTSLTRQFDLLERRLWRMEALVAGTGALGSLLLSCTLQFASDRIWDTPRWLRLAFALCGWVGFAIFAWRYGTHWIWGRRSIRALAVIVQKRYRRLGDRLLGIVELADPHARPSNYSPELCQAAIAQVAGEASSFDFQQAAGERQPRRYLLGFLALAALVTAIAVVTPAAGWNALVRWFSPVSNIERYTFVTIDALPGHLVVPQGEPFDIAIGLARDSFWRPHSAHSHFDGLPPTEAPIHDGVAAFHFPGQTQERLLWLSVGDVTRSIRIQPEVRPDLRQIRVRLDLPSYLQYPSQEQPIEAGALNFLPGTSAIFTGEAVRHLASATLQGDKPLPLQIDGPRFHTAPILLELERDFTLTWRDTLGLDGPTPATIHVTPKEDDPPDVELRGLEAAIAILPEETVHIDLNSTDDYGVRQAILSWQTTPTSPAEPPGPLHEIKLADGQPQARTLTGHYDFSPALLQIPADTTILVRGLAVDYYPARQPSSSPVYRIHVLSREAHARLIHDQFEKLMEQFEELTRHQEAILQSGKAVRSQTPQKLAADESAQKLAAQSSDQNQTAAQLADLARQMAATLAEALRNSQISPDTLKNWAGRAEQMQQLSAASMPAAARSLTSAQSDPAQRPQKLDQALGQEQAILDAMRQMATQANNDLESMTAQTLAARLRRAATSERDLASAFQKMLPDTIGMTPAQLPDDPRQKLDLMTAAHAEVTREAGRLEDEISRLFDRTSLNRYGDVAREMDGLKTEDNLAALGKLVQKNIGVQSIDTARYWSDQFDRWAARLGQQDDSKSASGGQAGQPDAAQLQALLALMRLRQQQDQLREQTSVLEERKQASHDDYSLGTQAAAQSQSGLRDQVQSMAQDPNFPVPPQNLAPVGKSMDDAAGLLAKPVTGQPTYAAQTDALNLLDAAIAQQAQKAGQSADALASMMGMGKGGGSSAGSSTDQPNVPIPGSREGQSPDQRTVTQSGGLDNSQLPGEFRDAIESYHRAIEQSQNP
jgi:hypothetical protein